MLVEERIFLLNEEGERCLLRKTGEGGKSEKKVERVEAFFDDSQSIPISSACLALALRVPDEDAYIGTDEGYSNDS